MTLTVLLCGGAGSHTALEFKNNGFNVVILDNLSQGHKEAVKDFPLYIGDVRDEKFLDKVFTENKIDAVVHFCGLITLEASCFNPLQYFDNNFSGTIKLLLAMQKYKCNYFIFSSTGSIFGIPKTNPITEDCEKEPINPYGESKLFVEKALKWCEPLGIKHICFRYFNASGAHESGEIGEDHDPESHLIPIIFQVALGKRKQISIFGNDYNTKDGTCVRDYIHVSDLGSAHVLGLKYLVNGGKSDVFNLGSERGYSVKEVIETVEKVSKVKIPYEYDKRREGDVDTTIANSEKAEKTLKWIRKYKNLEDILESAWKWHKNHPNGYKSE